MGRMKPHWELLHDWWIDDFVFEYEQMDVLADLLVKHPDDEMGIQLREMVKMVKWKLSRMQYEYNKIYGRRMGVARIRRIINEKT
jgi:hypothetical protein